MAELAEKSQELEAHLQNSPINIAYEYGGEEVSDENHPGERICWYDRLATFYLRQNYSKDNWYFDEPEAR